MDNQLLIGSLVINILLIIERFMKRIRKSECCGTKIELEKSTSIHNLNLNDIKVNDSNEQIQTNALK